MSEQTIDIPRLRRALEWALGEYQKEQRDEVAEWVQGDWMVPTKLVDDAELVAAAVAAGKACGTACCLGGKVAYDEGWRPHPGPYQHGQVVRGREVRGVRELAMELLGLTYDQAVELFAGDNSIHSLFQIAGELTDGEITFPPELAPGQRAA